MQTLPLASFRLHRFHNARSANGRRRPPAGGRPGHRRVEAKERRGHRPRIAAELVGPGAEGMRRGKPPDASRRDRAICGRSDFRNKRRHVEASARRPPGRIVLGDANAVNEVTSAPPDAL